MKKITFATILLGAASLAFASRAEEISSPTSMSIGGWFVGGTFGQLYNTGNNLSDNFIINRGQESETLIPPRDLNIGDLNFNMYTLHVGRDLGPKVIGFDLAAYLEFGYLDGSVDFSGSYFFNRREIIVNFSSSLDVDIIPITANLKLDRPIFGPVNVYLSGGLGYAFTDTKPSAGGLGSDNGSGFYAQASLGLLYNIKEHFEVYAGGRWVHLSSLDLGDIMGLEDNVAWEVGVRYNF